MNNIKGIVHKLSSAKTIIVKVPRMIAHPKYGKLMKKDRKYIVHAEKEVKIGDAVEIQPCKRMSKRKAFRLV